MKIKKVKLNKENLLKIQDIDDLFYTNTITGIEWYLERYNENHSAYLLFDEEKCVGYIFSVPIKEELYNAIVNGVLIGDVYINPNMFVKESDYQYISSVVILEGYRNKGYGSKLFEKLLKNLKGKCCALTVSDEGYKLVSKYMDYKMNVDKNINVFTKEY